MAPSRPVVTSIQKDQEGLTLPRSRRRASPSSGWSQSETRVPSLPPTRSVRPSDIQIDRYRQRSSLRVTDLGSPPDAGTTAISFTLFGSPSRGYQRASRLPSGL